jgi:hypothetical protein
LLITLGVFFNYFFNLYYFFTAMKSTLFVAAFLLLSRLSYAQETLLFQESFEESTAIKAIFEGKFYVDKNNFFCLSDQKISNTTAEYSDYDGLYFWAAEDIDHLGGLKYADIVFHPVITKGYKNLYAKVLVATGNEAIPNGSNGFDKGDSLIFYMSTDGGQTFIHALKFSYENNGDAFNEPIRQDLDFDGNGDGVYLTTKFQEFTFDLPDADSIIVKVVFTNDADTEELAIDNLRIYGTDVLTSTQTKHVESFQFGPNPFDELLNVSAINQEIVITDLMGQVYFEGKPETGLINTQHFAKGIYLLHIKDQKEVFKLIKE